MENLEEDVQSTSEKPRMIRGRDTLLYEGRETELREYLDSDPKYHNWSRSCDAGH